MAFGNFNEVVRYMERFINLEHSPTLYNSRTYRLDRMKAMLQVLGNPQNCYKTIHVAGSKGKGSTASYIASILNAEGYKTGLYMSPHVSDYRERFTLCRNFIPDNELIKAGNELEQKLDKFEYNGTNPTTFEMYTAFAFLLFKNLKCDYAVIETGLGGRLDATNVITPVASVLTTIELEHTDLLGPTIEAIATEKSKIIKNNTPSFSAFQKPEASEVFKKEALAQNSTLYTLENNLKSLTSTQNIEYQTVTMEFADNSSYTLNLKMLGHVQAQNCALAILTAKTLGLFDKEKAIKALENTTLPGRMEKLNFKRPLYLDGAHTEQSTKNLFITFREIYPGKKGICIFGSVEGKHHVQMSEQVLENFDKIVISRPGTFKKSNPVALFELFNSKKQNQTIVLKENAKDALQYCIDNTEPDEPVIACGSFYLAGEIKEALKCF